MFPLTQFICDLFVLEEPIAIIREKARRGEYRPVSNDMMAGYVKLSGRVG